MSAESPLQATKLPHLGRVAFDFPVRWGGTEWEIADTLANATVHS